jgi:uncharacterized protein with HEPN domain
LTATHLDHNALQKREANEAIVKVPDDRLDKFNEIFNPKKKVNTLIDIKEKNAVLMNLLQIGEKLNKIIDPDIRNSLPVDEAYSVRHRIIHDYGGIDSEILEYIIDNELPELKNKINTIIS